MVAYRRFDSTTMFTWNICEHALWWRKGRCIVQVLVLTWLLCNQMHDILTKLSIKSRKSLNVSFLLSVCSINTKTLWIELLPSNGDVLRERCLHLKNSILPKWIHPESGQKLGLFEVEMLYPFSYCLGMTDQTHEVTKLKRWIYPKALNS